MCAGVAVHADSSCSNKEQKCVLVLQFMLTAATLAVTTLQKGVLVLQFILTAVAELQYRNVCWCCSSC